MKNSFIIADIRRDLIRRLILPLLITAASLFVLSLTPRENIFRQRPMNYKSRYENFYNQLLPCVRVKAEELQYTGLDYYVNGSVKGHYYYTLVDGFCQFYLLDAKVGEIPAPSVESLDIHGRLIELKHSEYQTLLKTMAASLGWKASSLEEMSSPYAVSALPSAFYLNLLGRLAANLCLIFSLAELFWSLFCLAFPLSSPAFRYMADSEEACQALEQAETAILSASACKVKRAGKLLFIPSLLLFLDGAGTRLIPAEQIIWTSVRKSRSAASFCALASDGKSFCFPCPSWESARELECALRSQNPDIAAGKRPSLFRRKHFKKHRRKS